ncbi:phosphoglycolate phosphatase [Kushneria phosphatilytica]|uniref:Phosphoglycolate phosphatase n=1 Tax=Kushneria phosphatilytica TaxID=657387 RepID=A0A1S1NXK2_9GAMM|nr:phosphoglycolate phosphatase [Kushneria phosphatilytica]OHV12302.1 phosphoglycolate phosphatase [Kushneria phosphatilytica]QEL11507.1 phosphoglycolate phosphatase [Kushneria phosphatilytica]
MHAALKDRALICWDLDGTLIDSAPDLARAVDAVLAERGLPTAGLDNVRQWIGNGARKLVERALTASSGQVPNDETLTAAHADFLEYYRRAPCVDTRLYPGVVDCLAALQRQGMQQALVTNKPEAFIAPILRTFGIEQYFNLTLGGDALSQKKPDPAPLLHAASVLDVLPEKALMIGDSRNDIEAGRAAGFRTLALSWGYNHGEPIAASHPDYLLDSLKGLI